MLSVAWLAFPIGLAVTAGVTGFALLMAQDSAGPAYRTGVILHGECWNRKSVWGEKVWELCGASLVLPCSWLKTAQGRPTVPILSCMVGVESAKCGNVWVSLLYLALH